MTLNYHINQIVKVVYDFLRMNTYPKVSTLKCELHYFIFFVSTNINCLTFIPCEDPILNI